MADQQAGWYPDPSGDVSKLRYWDGVQWTNDFAAAQPQNTQEDAYSNPTNDQAAVAYYQQPVQTASSNDSSLYLAAFIFCIISTVCAGWLILPLAWMIPMTVHCWGIYKGTKSNTTGFGVCTLIFVSPVAGVLLLVGKKD